MKLLLILAMSTSVVAFAQERVSTPTAGCVDMVSNTTVKQETAQKSAGDARVYATITASRDADDHEARRCKVQYALLLSEKGQPFKTVASFEEEGQDAFGVDLIGFSPDGSKVAANFWWAAGDFGAVRPAIYDRATGKATVKELKEQITGQLQSCDYNQTMTGVTDAGEAVVHVPKSIFVETGCPDQGDWLFNLQTEKVRRVGKAGPKKTPSPD